MRMKPIAALALAALAFAPVPAMAQSSMAAYEAARQALLAIWAELPLTVRNVTLTAERANSYGAYTPRPGNSFAPGEKINVYVEVLGYGWQANEDGTVSELLEADLELRDLKGTTLASQEKFLSANIKGHEKLLETYLTLDATLTDFDPGDYILHYLLRDVAGGKQTEFEVPVTLTAAAP